MTEIIIILVINLSVFFVSKFFVKKKFLISQSGETHQRFTEKLNVPLIIGFYFFLTFVYVFYNPILLIFLTLIYSLGITSDINFIKSPKKRFFLQALIFIFFIFFLNLKILDTRIELINSILEINFFNFIFVLFCLMVLVNGSNFIDGLNGLVIGYYLVVSILLLKTEFFDLLSINDNEIYTYFSTFLIMWIANITRKGFLGDSGSYLLGSFFGVLIINFHQNHVDISPYYVILLVWYPCFENLFSIIRKFNLNNSPIFPDSNHFHQLVFLFIKVKFDMKDIYANNTASTVILLLVSIFLFLGSLNPYSTNLQIILLIAFSIIYILLYRFLFKFKLYFKK